MSLLFEPETLHFDINLAAADGAHLTISAGTLPLARRAVHLQEIAKS